LECGGLTPLSLIQMEQIDEIISNARLSQSGVKPPHSK
jgi:hypothetical protein